jgi:hypothetical protein
MSYINQIKCDGPDCSNINDLPGSGLEPVYHTLTLGGSDFEMSMRVIPEIYHFCSYQCLRGFLATRGLMWDA